MNAEAGIAAPLSAWSLTDHRIGEQAARRARGVISPTLPQRILARMRCRLPDARSTGPVLFEAQVPGGRPPVSIVVPTAGQTGAVDGVRRRYVVGLMGSLLGTLGGDDEVLVVVGPEAPGELAAEIGDVSGADPRVRVLVDTAEFNFAMRVNLGVAHSRADVVVLLNDDTEVLVSGWLDRMAQVAMLDGVGAVGATLTYEDGRLQHAGLTTIDGLPTHAWAGWDPTDPIDGGILGADRLAWGVTGAAMAVARSTWDRLGGFSAEFPLNYNDVDFCCKAAHLGLDNVMLASVRLRHFETRTRPRELHDHEVIALRRRWAHRLGPDRLVAGTSALITGGPRGDA